MILIIKVKVFCLVVLCLLGPFICVFVQSKASIMTLLCKSIKKEKRYVTRMIIKQHMEKRLAQEDEEYQVFLKVLR